MLNNKFLRQNVLFLCIIHTGSVFSYLFQVVAGRTMTPDDFGLFNSLNSMVALAAVPIFVLPMVLAKFTVRYSVQSMALVNGLVLFTLRRLGLLCLALLALGLLMLPAIKGYLNIPSTLPVVLALSQLALSMFLPMPQGILQGLQRFIGLGLTGSGVSLGKFLFALAFLGLLGWGVNGAVLAGVLSTVLSIGIGMLFLKDILAGPRQDLPSSLLPEMLRFSGPVLVTSLCLGAMCNLDIILVRHFCAPTDAGYYASAAIIGRIAFYLPGALVMVLFPAAAKASEDGSTGWQPLFVNLGLSGLMAGGFALVCVLWPAWVTTMLFGSAYAQSSAVLRLLAPALALMALCQSLFTYCLARSLYGYLWALVAGLTLMLGGIHFHHDHPIEVAQVILATAVLLTAASSIWFARVVTASRCAGGPGPETDKPQG